ncbi:Spermidine/spermine synthase family [Cynara cardunculus var. scolymus]|uniref:thermospermine synthase n=1 Tax=Cynara cardunculus var. scolymus TaxID=59895 RepID=A0A103YLJ2_CYNCS|nr:Spermidine/spermine synthase family [Cynara cardunculus var. scolymus]
MGEAVVFPLSNDFHQPNNLGAENIVNDHDGSWFEEVIDDDLKWSFALNSVLDKGISEYQDIVLLDTKRFGKALVIDGKMQSAESDEFIYHECLIHPPLLCHPTPKTVFIMGGGEGSAAREALKHESIEKVIMCDIDQAVVAFCREHLTANKEAFINKKLELIINDAKIELEERKEKFDIIVGDLADPVEGGPCYQLYTKSFYQEIVKPKLNPDGIFVTQMWSCTRVMCLLLLMNGDGLWLKNETHVYTEDNARFIHGQGVGKKCSH